MTCSSYNDCRCARMLPPVWLHAGFPHHSPAHLHPLCMAAEPAKQNVVPGSMCCLTARACKHDILACRQQPACNSALSVSATQACCVL